MHYRQQQAKIIAEFSGSWSFIFTKNIYLADSTRFAFIGNYSCSQPLGASLINIQVMTGYSIIENQSIEPHIKFLRIDPTDLKLTLKNILDSLMNLSWLGDFDKDYLRSSYEEKAKMTITYIVDNIINENDDTVTSSSGEYVVSELARLAVIDTYAYLDVPLAELFKKKDIGNHGFDFYTLNSSNHILFGEAKYLASQSAFGSALRQTLRFYNEKQHITDITEIQNFFCEESLEKCNKNELGFMVAFSSKKTDTKRIISSISKNVHYKGLTGFNEIILIAVNI